MIALEVRWLPLWLGVAAGLSAGCQPTTAPFSDVSEARQLLTKTLNAWVAGESLDEQRTKKPPVYVTEDLWYGGQQLQSFELHGDGEMIGTNARFHVTLHHSRDSQRVTRRDVTYLVTTAPAQTIAREDR